MSEQTDNLPDTVPVPPRYRWLKRFCKLGGLLLVGLLLLRWWWGWEAHRRLQAEIDRIVARGEPIFPEDFDPSDDIPDDQNAAIAFTTAIELLTTSVEQDEIISSRVKIDDVTEDQWQLFSDFETKNRKMLDLVQQARSMPNADWGLRFRSPVVDIDAMFSSLSPQRQLCRALSTFAVYQHNNSKDGQAIETLRAVFHQAEVVDQMPTLISHLVALAIDAVGVSRIERISHDLAIGDNPAAAREAVESLIAELLDETALSEGLRTAMQVERMWQLDTVRGVSDGKIGIIPAVVPSGTGKTSLVARVLVFPITPLYELDGVVMLRHMNQVLQVCEEPSWPAGAVTLQALEQAAERETNALGHIRRPLSSFFLPSFSRAVFHHYQDIVQRRMAAIALAIRLYEIDHGSRPAGLAELVPDYLDELPADPMAPDGATFRYLPEAKIPVLYSVGENGVDDGGLMWDEKLKKYNRNDRRDLVFLLDGQLPESTGAGGSDQSETRP